MTKRKVTLKFEVELEDHLNTSADRVDNIYYKLKSLCNTPSALIMEYLGQIGKADKETKKLLMSLIETNEDCNTFSTALVDTVDVKVDCRDLQTPKDFPKGTYIIGDMSSLMQSNEMYEQWLQVVKDGYYQFQGYDMYSVYVGNDSYHMVGHSTEIFISSGTITLVSTEAIDGLNLSNDALIHTAKRKFWVTHDDKHIEIGKHLIPYYKTYGK